MKQPPNAGASRIQEATQTAEPTECHGTSSGGEGHASANLIEEEEDCASSRGCLTATQW